MSRLDDLLGEHCPRGVDVKSLGDVGELIRGRRFTKADYVTDGLGVIHYGEIYTDYGTTATTTTSKVRAELKPTLRLARTGDLIIAATGENLRDVCKAVAWLGSDDIAVHDDCYIFRHSLDPVYVSYYFQSRAFQEQKAAYASESKVVRVSGENLARVQMPVPPLPVQREIVTILTKMEALEAELEAELEARRRQYAHYRRLILERVKASREPLAALGRWYSGVTPSKRNSRYWSGGDIPWLASMDVQGTTSSQIRGRVTRFAIEETTLKVLPAPTVVVVVRSNILRRHLPIGLVSVDTTINQDVRALVPREGVVSEYVYQALRAVEVDIKAQCVRTDGSMAAVESRKLLAFQIPVPDVGEQSRIAAELGLFDSLVHDLVVGLPAELEARRRQYAYYRDRLFDFEHVAA